MRRFWLDIAKRFPRLLWDAVETIEGVIAVAFFAVLLGNQKLGQKLLNWEGINPIWSLVPIAVLLIWAVMKAVYAKHELLEKALATTTAERDQFAAKLRVLEDKDANQRRRRSEKLELTACIMEGRRLDEFKQMTGAAEEMHWYMAESQEWLEKVQSLVSRDFPEVSKSFQCQEGVHNFGLMAAWVHKVVGLLEKLAAT